LGATLSAKAQVWSLVARETVPMSTRAQIQQLEAEFAEAMTRMYTVGNGLARLRSQLEREEGYGIPDAARPAPVPPPVARPAGSPAAPAAPPLTAPPLTAPSLTAQAPAPQPPAMRQPPAATPAPAAPPQGPWQQPAPAVPWYRREGAVTRVLAIAGAVITMAGVAMFLVLAAQRGWFGPEARVAAGALLAAVLIGLGVRSGRADLRERAAAAGAPDTTAATPAGVEGAPAAVGAAPVALVATGVATAYLVVVAMTTGYGWVPTAPGLALAGAVALAGLHLARSWRSELLAVLVVLGAAVLAPVVAQGGGWVVTGYLAILCLAGWWASGDRTTQVLTLARVLPLTLALLVSSVSGGGTADDVGNLAIAGLALGATLLTSTLSVRRDRGDVAASIAVALLSVGLFAATTTFDNPARTLALATASAALLLTATTLGRGPVGPVAGHLVVTTGAAGTVFAVLAVVAGAPTRFITTGLLLLAIVGLAVAGITRSRVNLALAAGVTLLGVVGWLQYPLTVAASARTLRGDMAAALLDSIVLAGVLAMVVWAMGQQRGLGRELRVMVRIAVWVLGLAASATALAAAGTLVGARLGDPTLGFTIGQAVATITWMLGAAWLLLHGLERSPDADLTLRTGLLLAAVSVAKLFLYDLSSLSGIVRSVAFIAVGLLLLAMGSRYAKAYERSRPPS
jgi:hypothetical protein